MSFESSRHESGTGRIFSPGQEVRIETEPMRGVFGAVVSQGKDGMILLRIEQGIYARIHATSVSLFSDLRE